ncbi:hypothetical protein BKA93DRAFT_784103 [Sparassis latifolia]
MQLCTICLQCVRIKFPSQFTLVLPSPRYENAQSASQPRVSQRVWAVFSHSVISSLTRTGRGRPRAICAYQLPSFSVLHVSAMKTGVRIHARIAARCKVINAFLARETSRLSRPPVCLPRSG